MERTEFGVALTGEIGSPFLPRGGFGSLRRLRRDMKTFGCENSIGTPLGDHPEDAI